MARRTPAGEGADLVGCGEERTASRISGHGERCGSPRSPHPTPCHCKARSRVGRIRRVNEPRPVSPNRPRRNPTMRFCGRPRWSSGYAARRVLEWWVVLECCARLTRRGYAASLRGAEHRINLRSAVTRHSGDCFASLAMTGRWRANYGDSLLNNLNKTVWGQTRMVLT